MALFIVQDKMEDKNFGLGLPLVTSLLSSRGIVSLEFQARSSQNPIPQVIELKVNQ